MSWRDALRLPVGEAAKQGAAKLREQLQREITLGALFKQAEVTQSRSRPGETPPATANKAGVEATPRTAVTAEPTVPAPSTQLSAPSNSAPTASMTSEFGSGNAAVAVAHRIDPDTSTDDGRHSFRAGDCIAELYEITRIAGRTPHFTTYLAQHREWNRPVAIKIPTLEFLSQPNERDRFIAAAARWTACGQHPNLVYCYDVHFVDDLPLLVVEGAEGGSLRQTLASRSPGLRTGLAVALQVCHALEHLHSRNCWYGTLTPENILFAGDGIVRVTDVGVSHWLDHAGEPYVAPEQWVDSSAAGPETDIFSLGVCLYEIFCGGRPYEMARGPRRNPPEPRAANGDALPPLLTQLLRRCVDWDQTRRPTTVMEIRIALARVHEEALGTSSVLARLDISDCDSDGWNNQGMVALLHGRHDEAEVAWENALAADAQHLESLFNLGVTRWRRGALTDEALVGQLTRIRNANPTASQPAHLLGLVHLERGDASSALPLLEHAAALAPAPATDEALALARRLTSSGSGRISRECNGHLQFVSAVAVSPDGSWILSAGDDNAICLWEANTGRLLRRIDGHTRRISSIAMTHDSRLALSGSDDFTLRLWDVRQGRCTRTIELAGKVFGVSLSADGRWAASTSSGTDNFLGVDGTLVELWDLEKGRLLRRFEGHTNAVKSVALTPDGKRVATAGDDRSVRVWDGVTGKSLRVFRGHEHYVTSVAISGDGSRVLSGSWDRTIRLWDVHSGECVREFPGHTGIVTSVAMNGDASLLASGSWDGAVRIWDAESGRCVRTFEGHTSMVTGVALSSDGRVAGSGSWDCMVRVWDVPGSRPAVCTLQLSRRANGSSVAGNEPDAEELLADAEQALRGQHIHEALRYYRRARELLGNSRPEKARALGKALAQRTTRVAVGSTWPLAEWTAPDRVAALAAAFDARHLLSVGRDARLRLWDTEQGRCVRAMEGHADRILDLKVARRAALAASSSADGSVRVWDLASGACARLLSGHTSAVTVLAIGDDDRRLVSGSYDHTLMIWDLMSGAHKKTLEGHRRQVTALAMDEAGGLIASGAFDGEIRIWDGETGATLATWEAHQSAVTALALSSDGRTLLSGGADGTVRLWKVGSGEPLREYNGVGECVTVLQFIAGGRWIVVGAADGCVRLWDVRGEQDEVVLHRSDAAITAVSFTRDEIGMFVADGNNRISSVELEWELEPTK